MKKIEKLINDIFVEGRNRFSMQGINIDKCKYGVMFLNSQNRAEASRLVAIIAAINWAKEGIPALACVSASSLIPAPVLELWISTKDNMFDEARALAVHHIHSTSNTNEWRLIKSIDNPSRKGTVFVFVANDALANLINTNGIIRFKFGFFIARSKIKFPRGYTGNFNHYTITQIFNVMSKFQKTPIPTITKLNKRWKSSASESSLKSCAKRTTSNHTNPAIDLNRNLKSLRHISSPKTYYLFLFTSYAPNLSFGHNKAPLSKRIYTRCTLNKNQVE